MAKTREQIAQQINDSLRLYVEMTDEERANFSKVMRSTAVSMDDITTACKTLGTVAKDAARLTKYGVEHIAGATRVMDLEKQAKALGATQEEIAGIKEWGEIHSINTEAEYYNMIEKRLEALTICKMKDK